MYISKPSYLYLYILHNARFFIAFLLSIFHSLSACSFCSRSHLSAGSAQHPHAVTSSMYKVDIFNCYISHSAQLSGLRSAAVKADGFIRARLHMPLASHSLSIRELFFSPYTYVIPSSPIIFIFPDIINLIKSKRIIAAARVERMGKIRNSSTYLVE